MVLFIIGELDIGLGIIGAIGLTTEELVIGIGTIDNLPFKFKYFPLYLKYFFL